MEKKIAGAKGIFKAKQRKELQEQAEELKTQIANMKQYLSSVVQGYGHKNVKEFLAEYKASKVEYGDYRKALAEWEKLTGEKVDDSLKAKLQQKQQQVKEQYRHTEYQNWSGKLLRFYIVGSIKNLWRNCIYHDIIVFNEGEN